MLKLRTKTYILVGMSMLTLVPISTSCIWKWDKELTLKQVRDKTEVSIENISKLKINQVKKEQIKLKGPTGWNMSVLEIEIRGDGLLVKIRAKKGVYIYGFEKLLTGFAN